jgi:hypothetical protein
MSHRRRLLLIILSLLGTPSLLASTYAVGNCKPKLPNFPTITAAVSGVPPNSTIEVCPGVYPEQFTISQPLTLRGIVVGNAARAVITVPISITGAPSLQANTVSQETGVYLGGDFPFAAQVLVQTAGPVNITDITIDGSGNNLACSVSPYIWLAGVFYTSGSSGTVNRVTTRKQLDQGCGNGIWVEDTTGPNQTVSILNSSIHDFDFSGIFAGTDGVDSWLSVSVKGNAVNGQSLVDQYGAAGINTSFATAAVSGNVVTGGSVGIFNLSSAPLATVSGNTVADVASGIVTGYDGGIIRSNKISNTSTAVDLQSNDATAGSNTITNTTVAIDFECSTGTVGSNVINDAMTALDQIPTTLVSNNTYDNVDAIRVNCAASNSARKLVSFKLAGR